MRYVFCIIALLIQPVSAWYVYHKQNKTQAALKMPMIYYSGVYLVVQLYVFFKFCSKFPEEYQYYSYLIQAGILAGFLVLEFILFCSNRYIEDVNQKQKDSIREFKNLIRELEISKLSVSDGENLKKINDVLEKMKNSDPVSSSEVVEENEKIHELIIELHGVTDRNLFEKKCDELVTQLEIRNIKNTKE